MYILTKISMVIARLLRLYSFLIWIRIIMSWFTRSYKEGSFSSFLAHIVDPYINAFKRSGMTIGILDFSPIIAIGIISVLESIFAFYGVHGFLTFALILSFSIQAFWSYGLSIYLSLLIILMIFRLIASFSQNPMMAASYYRMTSGADSFCAAIKSLFGRNYISDRAVSIIGLILSIMMYFGGKYLFSYLMRIALRIPF